ncbi:DUF6531 domain-containing protein [Streptomyces sp. SL13]|uniref:DUF6531 domain-containing protein n=1 Tax=Streptantibioticus silvisoli TaxID=2705255 RepID=A0AA90GY70_9ACTN|nr:DUF6531 domain-containing protein [Streptantibioticus silvisoli]MDI5969954.1 DUF6531 domain-containing protein [Streptantibioticus silvisoli]
MSDIVGKIVKPTAEFLEDLARKLPSAFGKGHHRIGTSVHKAADEFDKAEDDVTAAAKHHPGDAGTGHHDPADPADADGVNTAGGGRGGGGNGGRTADGAHGGGDDDSGAPDARPDDGDRDSRPPESRHCEGDPVDVASGELVMSVVDVRLPGALPLAIRRTHLSSYRNGGWFGTSWASTLDQRLQLDADGIVLVGPDGTRLEYPAPREGAPVVPFKGPRLPLGWSGRPNEPMTVLDPRSGQAMVFDHPRPAPGVPGAVTLRLTSIQDRNGRRIDIEWSQDDTPRLLSHHGGYRVAVDVHPELRRITGFRLLDTDGPGTGTTLARYGYDDAGDLTEVFNSSGVPLRLTYDDHHRITSWTDRTGTAYGYAYDAAGRVVRTTGSDGFLSGAFAYDDAARTTRYTNSLGHTTTHEFNAAYRTIRSTDPLGQVRVQEWSEDNRLLKSFTDPLGRTTRYEHDASENVSAVVGPDGTRTAFTYDVEGLPVTLTDPAGRVWRTEYDAWGNRLATVDPLGARTAYAYDEDTGDLTGVTDALGARTLMVSDAAGLPVSVTDERGGVTSARRDAFGRIVEATDPMGNTVRVGWTTDGQVERVERSDGRRESWAFDADGKVVSHTDAAGVVHTLAPTHFDLVASSTTADGSTYAFSYDTEKHLTAVTDPLGRVWEYAYDPTGRLVQETDFDGRVLRYTYDAAGQLASRSNGAGETVTFERDVLGRVTAHACGDDRTTHDYDAAGNLWRTRNADAEVLREYDVMGRVTAESVNGRTITYAYDLLGRRTERRTPSGVVSTWSYDSRDVPGTLVMAGHRTTFAFDPLGRESARRVDDRLTLSHDWDGTGRLTRRSITRGTPDDPAPLLERHYAYGADDLLTEIRDLTTGVHRFALDPSGRVTSVTAEGWTESYAYDAVGNLTHAATPVTAPDDAPREFDGTRLRRAGRTSYEHDAQGRVVRSTKRLLNGQRQVRTFTWNAYDQLIATVTPDGHHWRYRYDAAGRRIGKQRFTDAAAVAEEIHFTWDVVTLAEQSTDRGATTTWEYSPGGLPLAQVDHAADPLGTDARFHAIVTDLVGTPTELLTPEGDIAWQPRTTLWGLPTAGRDATVDCPLRFPGQYADPETGWNHNHFRHYDPETARYTAPDPLGLSPAPDPVGYVPNPTAWSDPLGLKYKPNLPGWDKWEPQDTTWGGNVTYSPLDEHGRPTKVTAHITSAMLGQSTDPHIRNGAVPGWQNGMKFNRTHLLAASLGGSNKIPQNFVAMHRWANHPIMYHYEGQAANGVGVHGSIDYEVTAHYHQVLPETLRPEDLRPIGMTVRATSPDGKFQFTPYPQSDTAVRQILHYDEHGNLNAVTILNVPGCGA